MPLSGRALVTGGGRGIGENIARALADAGMRVIVTARTQEQVGAVAREIGGRALVGDVSNRDDVERWASEAGEVDLLVCNAGIGGLDTPLGDPDAVVADVRGERARPLSLLQRVRAGDGRARRRADREHRERRRLPAAARDAADGVRREQGGRPPVLGAARGRPRAEERLRLLDQPRPREDGDDEAASRTTRRGRRRSVRRALVLALASGEFDALAGRYLHAEHDPPESLRGRVDEILEQDLNAIRLRR